MVNLFEKHCEACEGGIPVLTPDAVANYLKQLPQWKLASNGGHITLSLQFKNFHETMAFVNAVAWIAHQENHHPDMTVGYDYCQLNYSTHAVGGLTENDFICAAKIDQLLKV